MSSSKQLIINCGASRVTAAVTEVQSGALNLERWVTVPLDYDFTEDEAWLGAVRTALHELAHEHRFSGKATIIIPGNQVLTKTIRIPHVEEAKRAQILAFEAQQNIPYPLHEVVWDSQVVGDDGVETEVLFIACKANTIKEICTIVRGAGFTPERINAATILEYNALQLASKDFEEDVLLINIGARSTNLIFKSENGFFARNIQLGGNTLTQNIADSLGKPFAQAEEIKQKFFSGEIDYGDDDSGAKLLQGSADAFVRRISQEITRSIVNYRRQKNAPAPKRILLTGRGALLRGLSEQLSSSQKITVDFFDPLKGAILGGGITTDAEELRLEAGEIIGEAGRGLVEDSAGVNLLPGDLQAEMAFRSKKPILLVAAVCLALAPWPAFVGYKNVSAAYSQQAKTLENQAAPLKIRQSEIASTEDRARSIGESIDQIEGLKNSKANWIQFFAKLQESLMQVEDVWLDDLSLERQEPAPTAASDNRNEENSGEKGDQQVTFEMVLRGTMLVRESAGEGEIDREVLTRRIKLLQSSFESSEFIQTSRSPQINWEPILDGLNVLPFTINLVVEPSKTL